jgi:hypothetical protein
LHAAGTVGLGSDGFFGTESTVRLHLSCGIKLEWGPERNTESTNGCPSLAAVVAAAIHDRAESVGTMGGLAELSMPPFPRSKWVLAE